MHEGAYEDCTAYPCANSRPDTCSYPPVAGTHTLADSDTVTCTDTRANFEPDGGANTIPRPAHTLPNACANHADAVTDVDSHV